MSVSWTTKLIRNVLHQHIGGGNYNQAIFLIHGLGGNFGQHQQLGEMLHRKVIDHQIINVSLPLHNDAPSLHGDNDNIEWQSIDIEHMLSVLCEEYSINKCILIGSAFTGYPMIGFRLNNPFLVNSIISTDWMIKAPTEMITDPNILYNDNNWSIEDFKNGLIQRFTNNGNAPQNVIDYINESVGNFVIDHNKIYKAQQYVFNCYKRFGEPYQAFKFLFDYEKEKLVQNQIDQTCDVLFLSNKQSDEQESIISELKNNYYPRFISKTMGQTLFLTVEQPDDVCKAIIDFLPSAIITDLDS